MSSIVYSCNVIYNQKGKSVAPIVNYNFVYCAWNTHNGYLNLVWKSPWLVMDLNLFHANVPVAAVDCGKDSLSIAASSAEYQACIPQ